MRVPFALKAVVAVSAVVLLWGCRAAGAGTGQPTSPVQDYHGSPVPTVTYSPDDPGPSPVSIPEVYTGATSALVGLQMENALGDQIGQNVPIVPVCDGLLTRNGSKPTVVRCYAHWRGLAVPFQVTLTAYDGYEGVDSVETRQLDGLLVASTVRTAWAQRNANLGGPLSCDKNLPAAQVVPFGQPTKYLCAIGPNYYSVELDYNPATGTTPGAPGEAAIEFSYFYGPPETDFLPLLQLVQGLCEPCLIGPGSTLQAEDVRTRVAVSLGRELPPQAAPERGGTEVKPNERVVSAAP